MQKTAKPVSTPEVRVIRMRQAVPALGIAEGDQIAMDGGTALLFREIPVEVARALGAVEAAAHIGQPVLQVLQGGAR